MLGKAVLALASANDRVVEAKAVVELHESRRSGLLKLGWEEAAVELSTRVKHLQLHLDSYERDLTKAKASVYTSFNCLYPSVEVAPAQARSAP